MIIMTRKVFLLLLILLTIVVLWVQVAPSLLALLAFLLFLFLILFIPGRCIMGLAGVQSRRLETLACSLVIGMLGSTTVFWCLSLLQQSWWFFFWLGGALLVWLLQMAKRGAFISPCAMPRTIGWPTQAVLGLYLLMITIFFSLGLFDTFTSHPHGGFTVSLYPDDGLFHAAIVHELKNGIPPQNPLIAGSLLNYSYFMDVLVLMVHKGTGIPVTDLLYRLFPLFWFGLLILSIFTCSRHVSGSEWTAVLCVFLVLFGGGVFNILPGLLFLRPGQLWELSFHSSTMVTMLYVNPMIPGLSVFYTGLLCLGKSLKTGSRAWLILAGFVVGVLTEFKLFGTLLVIGSLLTSGLWHFLQTRQVSLLKALPVVLFLSMPFLLYHGIANVDAAHIVARIRLGSFLIWSLDYWHLGWLAEELRILLYEFQPSVTRVLWFFLLLPVYIGGALGIRLVILPSLFQELRPSRASDPMKLLLLFMFAGGLFLTFVFSIIPKDLPDGYNNGIWLHAFALHAATLLAAERIVAFLKNKRVLTQALVLSCVLLLCAPSAVQLFWRALHARPFVVVTPAEAQGLDYLSQNTPTGAVILKDPQITDPRETFLIPGVAGRRIVLSSSYMVDYHLPAQGILQRTEQIGSFFREPGINGPVLDRYGVAYVWADWGKKRPPWEDTVLCFHGEGSSQMTHILRRVHHADGLFSIYKVEPRKSPSDE